MVVDLDKDALVSLVCGQWPYYTLFDHPIVKNAFNFSDQYRSYWSESSLQQYTEDQLFELYHLCKNSWIKK